ncbi:diacylglycerol O-acyltransferase 1 [Balamuthia mandrillaris]
MVRWAPLSIPIERRLQTAAVLFWAFTSPLFTVPLCLLSYALLLLFLPLLFIPYCLWAFYWDSAPSRGGRPLRFMRSLKVWRYFRDYYPVKLVKTAELDPDGNYLFCYHPHGIISVGAFTNFATEANDFSKVFPGIDLRLLTLKMNFMWPLYREYLLSMGLCDVSWKSCNYNLSRGKGASIMIVIGGAQEALDAHPGTNDLTLRKRKGFVRVALRNGASLVPVFSFGENNLFAQVPNAPGTPLRTWQDKLQKRLGFSMPLFTGRGIFNYDFGLLPQRAEIVSVVGAPLQVPKIEEPTAEDVDKWHALYIEKLTELYDTYKDVYDKDRIRDMRVLQ